MTDTTRETADHAELSRLAEAATPGDWRTRRPSRTVVVALDEDGRVCGEVLRTVSGSLNSYREANAAFIAAANPATVLALMSEIAALRGELSQANKNADGYKLAAEIHLESATQAERQRNEAVHHAKRLLAMQDGLPMMGVQAEQWATEARAFLANQGADQ